MKELEITSLISFKIKVPDEVVEDFENSKFKFDVGLEDTKLYQYINKYYKENNLCVEYTKGVYDEEADKCLYEEY